MIKERLKILIVEDDATDLQLIEYQINKIVENPFITHVKHFEEFKASLSNFIPDVILSDYKLNGFTGMDVLNYSRSVSPETTFVFITGTINNEEIAANTILSGASDYILKKNIKKLHEKLLPLFQKIIESKKIIASPKYKETIDAIKGFIESANKSNDMHIENYKSMKDSLEQFRKKIK